MNYKLIVSAFYLFLLPFCFNSFASIRKNSEPQNTIKFTENKNQWDKKVLYRAQLDGGVLFLESNCFTYNFYDKETLRKSHIRKPNEPFSNVSKISSHAFRMRFVNADETVELLKKEQTSDYCNFFIGQDKSRWAGNVKNYKELIYKQIYDGIDLQLIGLQNELKYNFIVSPMAKTEDIQLSYEGLESISIRNGCLLLKTSINEIVEQKPYAYQLVNGKQVEVPCEFILKNTTVEFGFPQGYDKSIELIIDPVLVFACSSGSTADNFGMTATYDSFGCLYAGGTCFSQGYPITLGAFDVSYNGISQSGRTDVTITKYDATGTSLMYSTYLGGAVSTEIVSSLIVNEQNELMLFGATGSSDFPITTGAYDITFNGGNFLSFQSNGTEYDNGTDLYVSKFNSDGTNLLASTFVGGTQNDGANASNILGYNYGDYYRGEIQVDNLGNAYIASCTYSSDFPTTAGCPQAAAGGALDGVLFKMDPSFSSLIWSTYIGGNADDGCYALAMDDLLNVYTTGGTASNNFPITSGTIDTTYNGGSTDGFITKIKNDGTSIMNSTFIGTGSYDQSFLIQFDKNFDLYIIGQTEGTMPVTPGTYSNPNSKQFIWKIDSTLNTVLFTTIFGNGSGQVNITPSAFLVDGCDNIYVCGWGGNILTGIPTSNMPLTANAFQSSTDGFNFYLFVLTPNASSLLYATYFGGNQSSEHVDGGTSRFDKKGIVYQAVCSGCGGNDDFPVTPGAWPNTGSNVNHSFNCNEGAFKFDFQASGVSAELLSEPNDTICVGTSVTFNNSSTNAFNYVWDFGDGSAVSVVSSPNHVYSSQGSFNVMLIAIDSSGCILFDTAYLMVVVLPPPIINLGNDTLLCQTPNLLLDAGSSAMSYLWSTGATTQTIQASAIGVYKATVSNGVCSVADSINIQQYALLDLGQDTTLCEGQSLVLKAPQFAASYQWSTGAASQTITVSSAGLYWVKVNWAFCQTIDTINIVMKTYPIVSLPPLLQICPGDSMVLNPGINNDVTYQWSTGEGTPSIMVFLGGTYNVSISNGPCMVWDTSHVIETSPITLQDKITLCDAESYLLDAGPGASSYLWSNGETSQTIELKGPGKYWVVKNAGDCKLSDTSLVDGSMGSGVLWVPNSFTPNGDLLNDYFEIKGIDITSFQLMIFNRWGELVYETSKMESFWEGAKNGKFLGEDVYIWKIKYKTICSKNLLKIKTGHISLIR